MTVIGSKKISKRGRSQELEKKVTGLKKLGKKSERPQSQWPLGPVTLSTTLCILTLDFP